MRYGTLAWRLVAAWKWRRQGRMTDVPVVMRRGVLTIGPDGEKGFSDRWEFEYGYLSQSVPIDEVWGRLARRYPLRVRRVERS